MLRTAEVNHCVSEAPSSLEVPPAKMGVQLDGKTHGLIVRNILDCENKDDIPDRLV